MPPRSAVRDMEHTCHGEWRTPATRSDPSNSCIPLSYCSTGTSNVLMAGERRRREGKSAAGTSSWSRGHDAWQQTVPCEDMRCRARVRCNNPLRSPCHRCDCPLVVQPNTPNPLRFGVAHPDTLCEDGEARMARRGWRGEARAARRGGEARAARRGRRGEGPEQVERLLADSRPRTRLFSSLGEVSGAPAWPPRSSSNRNR